MDVFDAILGRRSVRRFQGRPLDAGQLERILEAARWAPSAGNIQPWRFVVVKDAGAKNELVRAAYGQRFIGEAPVVIGVLALPDESGRRYGDRGRHLYALQDTAAAVQNVLLAAYGMGLGTCWVGAFDETAAARALGCSPGERPVALVPIGWPAEEGRSVRFGLDRVVRYIG